MLLDNSEQVWGYPRGGLVQIQIDIPATDGIRFVADPSVCAPDFVNPLPAGAAVIAGGFIDASTQLPGGGTERFFHGRWQLEFSSNPSCYNKYLGLDVGTAGYVGESAERILMIEQCVAAFRPPSPPPPSPPPPSPPPPSPPPIPPRTVATAGDGGCYNLGGDHQRAACCAASDARSDFGAYEGVTGSPCYFKTDGSQGCEPLVVLQTDGVMDYTCP